MVNLTFCRLDDSYLINSGNSEAHHSSISIFHIPSAGRSYMLEFRYWFDKSIWIGAFQIACGLFGHLLFGFRFPGEILFSLILREDQLIIFDLGSWSDLLDALVSWWIFSNNRRRPFRSRPFNLRNFFGSFDWFGGFCLLLCLCIILTWNPIDYLWLPFYLVVHQRIYCLGISSLCL